MLRTLAYVLMAAGVCWICSETLELVFAGRTGLTLVLIAAFHLLMAGGIWGAYAGQVGGKGGVSRVAAGLASAGYLLLVYPPIAVALDPAIPYVEFVQARPLFMAAGMLVTIGVTVFGAAVLRSHTYPYWVGLACLISPIVFATVLLSGGPPLLEFAANMLLASAFVTMGALALRTLPNQPR